MDSNVPFFTQLRAALNLEKEADRNFFNDRIHSIPLRERVKKGYSWSPVRIVKQGYTIGDRVYIWIETSVKEGEEKRFLRSGNPVRFFGESPNGKEHEQSGVIDFIGKGRMKIILNCQDLPDWTETHRLGVDPVFDERTYQEMEFALSTVEKARGDRLAELRDVMLGKRPAQFDHFAPFDNPKLNPSQQNAVSQVLAAQQASVIHGPPGTGKTTTLVEAIKQLSKTERSILVTAPSNTAVDLLTELCAKAGLQVVRIGHISRVDPEVVDHTLEAQLSNHPEAAHIKKVKIEAADYRKRARVFKRKFGHDQRTERQHLYRQARELTNWVKMLEDRLLDQVLESAQVVCCTFVGSNHQKLAKRKFRTVIIDEAAQALEPATWIPICKASRVVLAGDPYQLPPTVKSNEALRAGLGVTLIERCLQLLPTDQIALLTTQYRMSASIMGFSNHWFYGGKLKAADTVGERKLAFGDYLPLTFIDTVGCGFDEKLNRSSKSRFNPEEYLILREHLMQLVDAAAETEQPDIVILSPYNEQVQHITAALEEDENLSTAVRKVSTIDGYQGQEADVVYISLVRSNDKGELGFLKDYRRMNVALTRARKLLVVIGDSGVIGTDPFYLAFLEFVEQNGAYKTAWEYLHSS